MAGSSSKGSRLQRKKGGCTCATCRSWIPIFNSRNSNLSGRSVIPDYKVICEHGSPFVYCRARHAPKVK